MAQLSAPWHILGFPGTAWGSMALPEVPWHSSGLSTRLGNAHRSELPEPSAKAAKQDELAGGEAPEVVLEPIRPISQSATSDVRKIILKWPEKQITPGTAQRGFAAECMQRFQDADGEDICMRAKARRFLGDLVGTCRDTPALCRTAWIGVVSPWRPPSCTFQWGTAMGTHGAEQRDHCPHPQWPRGALCLHPSPLWFRACSKHWGS